MPTQESTDLITRLQTVITVDNGRTATDPFKLPATLRADAVADLAALQAADANTDPAEGQRAAASGAQRAADANTDPAEGQRAAASGAQRAALTELERQLRGGYKGIASIDETTITEAQRLGVFEAYGWHSGQLGRFDDARVLALSRQAPTVAAADVGGNAAWLYVAARLARIAAQLAIYDAAESTASGADRSLATLRRNTAIDLAGTTLLRVRFFYCSATRDADATPELTRIGYQPRRAPGTVDHGPAGQSSSSRSSHLSIGSGPFGPGASSSSSR